MTPEEIARCTETGVCAVHHEEVDRRRTNENTVNRVLRKLNIMIGVSLLGSLVITGSYLYTAQVGSRSERLNELQEARFDHHQELSQLKMDKMMETVSALAKTVAVAIGENNKDHEHLVEAIDRLEGYLDKGELR